MTCEANLAVTGGLADLQVSIEMIWTLSHFHDVIDLTAGQCNITDTSSEESHECRRTRRQGFLCCFD